MLNTSQVGQRNDAWYKLMRFPMNSKSKNRDIVILTILISALLGGLVFDIGSRILRGFISGMMSRMRKQMRSKMKQEGVQPDEM
jgi:hypothetical protein